MKNQVKQSYRSSISFNLNDSIVPRKDAYSHCMSECEGILNPRYGRKYMESPADENGDYVVTVSSWYGSRVKD